MTRKQAPETLEQAVRKGVRMYLMITRMIARETESTASISLILLDRPNQPTCSKSDFGKRIWGRRYTIYCIVEHPTARAVAATS